MKKKKSNKKIIGLCLGSAIVSTAVIAVAAACGVDRADLTLEVKDTMVKDNRLYVHVSVPYRNENTIELIKKTTFSVIVKPVQTANKPTKKVYANQSSKALESSIKHNPLTNQVDFYLEFPKINDKYKTITDEVEIIISPNQSFKLVSNKYSKVLYKILDLEASSSKMAINSLDAAINFNIQNATNISIQTIIQDKITKEQFSSEKTLLTNQISYDVVFKNFLIQALNNDLDEKLDLTNLLFANLKATADQKSQIKPENSTIDEDVKTRTLQLINYIDPESFGHEKLLKDTKQLLSHTYEADQQITRDQLLISILAEFIGYYLPETNTPYGYLSTKYIDLASSMQLDFFNDEEKTQLETLKKQIMEAANKLIPADILEKINQQSGTDFKDKVIKYVESLDDVQKNTLLETIYHGVNGYVWAYQYDFFKMEVNKLYTKPLIAKKMALVDDLLNQVNAILNTDLTSQALKTILEKNQVALGFEPLKDLNDKLQVLDKQLDTFKQKDNENVLLALQEVRKTYDNLIINIHKIMQLNDLKNMSVNLINFFVRDLSSAYEKTSDEQTNLNQLKAIQEFLKKPQDSVQPVKELITQNKLQEKQGWLNNLLTELKNKKVSKKDLYVIKRNYLFIETKIYNAQNKYDPTLKQFFKSPDEKNEFTFEYNLVD
ncbi:hypothetical protein OF375_01390 [Ureaplasma miroungigenitalium]|uniref:hypothetical protein n=1 Tax=Ureaplasma miroungigenitalium TaxID=1042321 RepID=UPI0021E81D1B|nr:hypothetical protein [Ureaplasma miroungigenitalium]MCV3734223.1 hypothetical protein [Ureaplasma miroungigenitalium]